jgi:hypothetical protein
LIGSVWLKIHACWVWNFDGWSLGSVGGKCKRCFETHVGMRSNKPQSNSEYFADVLKFDGLPAIVGWLKLAAELI